MGHSIHAAARVCLFFPKRRVISSVIFANPTAPTGTATDTAGVASVLLKLLNSYFQPQARLIGEARPHGAILSLLRGRNFPGLSAWEAWQLRQRHRHSLTSIITTLWVEGHRRRASIVSNIPVNQPPARRCPRVRLHRAPLATRSPAAEEHEGREGDGTISDIADKGARRCTTDDHHGQQS